MIIRRTAILDAIETALARSPVVVLSGPRQCGKTTLARELLSEDSVSYFDLEDPVSLARLDEPQTALQPLEGLVVIDEVQRRPDLSRSCGCLPIASRIRRASSSWAAPPAILNAKVRRVWPGGGNALRSAVSPCANSAV